MWIRTVSEPPAATKDKRGSRWKERSWVKRTHGAGARARTPESGGKTYPGHLHNNGRHVRSISVEVSRKINGSEQGRGGWVIYLRESRCRWKCLSRKGFETEEERWRSWRGCFILKGVKKEKKKKRCSYRDDWEAIKKERRPVFSLTCLPVTACDGGGVMCQADDGSWAASTIKTCLSAQPLCSILWKVKMGGVHIVCVCVCVCMHACAWRSTATSSAWLRRSKEN